VYTLEQEAEMEKECLDRELWLDKEEAHRPFFRSVDADASAKQARIRFIEESKEDPELEREQEKFME